MPTSEAAQFAEQEGLLFFEVSAKSAEGVEGLFAAIGAFVLLARLAGTPELELTRTGPGSGQAPTGRAVRQAEDGRLARSWTGRRRPLARLRRQRRAVRVLASPDRLPYTVPPRARPRLPTLAFSDHPLGLMRLSIS